MAQNNHYKKSFTKEELERLKMEKYNEGYNVGLNRGNAFAVDMGILAIGKTLSEMDNDIYEKAMEEYIRLYLEEAKEFGALFLVDAHENHDKEFWWAGDKLDKELREYLGKAGIHYPNFDERYCVKTEEE